MQDVIEFLKDLLVQIWAFDGVKFIVGHVIVNFVVAIAAAAKVGKFDLTRLSEFLLRKLLPYVLVYAILKVFGDSIGLSAIAPAAWAIITASLLGDLAGSLEQLGMPMPDVVKNIIGRGTNKPAA